MKQLPDMVVSGGIHFQAASHYASCGFVSAIGEVHTFTYIFGLGMPPACTTAHVREAENLPHPPRLLALMLTQRVGTHFTQALLSLGICANQVRHAAPRWCHGRWCWEAGPVRLRRRLGPSFITGPWLWKNREPHRHA